MFLLYGPICDVIIRTGNRKLHIKKEEVQSLNKKSSSVLTLALPLRSDPPVIR